MASPNGQNDGHFYRHHLEEIIKCPICLGTSQDPVITRCHHSFCKACIQRLFDKAISDSYPEPTHVRCPACRKRIRIPKSPSECLPASSYVLQTLDILKAKASVNDIRCDICKDTFSTAVVFCKQCNERYCGKCCIAHNKFKKYHTVSSLEDENADLPDLEERKSDIENGRYCRKHGEFEIESFCLEVGCKIPICKECEKDHKYHNKIPLAEKALLSSGDVKQCVKVQKSKLEKLDHCQTSLKRQKEKLLNESVKAKEDVRETASGLKMLVDEKLEAHLKEIDDKSSSQIKEIETRLERIGTEFTSRNSLIRRTESLTNQHNAILVRETPLHIEQFEKIPEEDIDDSNLKHKHYCLRFIQFEPNASRISNGLGKIVCGSADNATYLSPVNQHYAAYMSPVTQHYTRPQSEITGITFGNEGSEGRSRTNSVFSDTSSNLSLLKELDEAATLVPVHQRSLNDRIPAIGRIDELRTQYLNAVARI